jgi:GTP cyclohydrolase IA
MTAMTKSTEPRRARKRTRQGAFVRPHAVPVDHERLAAAIREILLAVGENPERQGLLKTPDRVARMYAEVFAGLNEDPARHLNAVFNEDYDEMVALRDIPFYSMCEHHLLPFTGRAHIAYVPGGRIIGVSKLARIVECFARRPQVQERLTSQIADLLMNGLKARGVAVVIEASHSCMTVRGVKKPGAEMVTSAVRGLFKANMATRNEVLSFLNRGR